MSGDREIKLSRRYVNKPINLDERKKKVLEALSSATSEEYGEKMKSLIKEKKLSRVDLMGYLRDPDFLLLLQEERRGITEAVKHRVHVAAEQAVEVLISLMASPNEHIRMKAASHVLDHAYRMNEVSAVEERLVELEQLACRRAI